MKHIFTRTQAVSVLIQARNGITKVDIFAHVDSNENLLKMGNEELFKKLCQIIGDDEISDVVDDPKFLDTASS